MPSSFKLKIRILVHSACYTFASCLRFFFPMKFDEKSYCLPENFRDLMRSLMRSSENFMEYE